MLYNLRNHKARQYLALNFKTRKAIPFELIVHRDEYHTFKIIGRVKGKATRDRQRDGESTDSWAPESCGVPMSQG